MVLVCRRIGWRLAFDMVDNKRIQLYHLSVIVEDINCGRPGYSGRKWGDNRV